jgi:hypothetical protein
MNDPAKPIIYLFKRDDPDVVEVCSVVSGDIRLTIDYDRSTQLFDVGLVFMDDGAPLESLDFSMSEHNASILSAELQRVLRLILMERAGVGMAKHTGFSPIGDKKEKREVVSWDAEQT